MNILLIASKMNYGGAESHVYSLASALLFCSHKVTLLSEGGETAERLSQIGVKTLNAPLSKKDPICAKFPSTDRIQFSLYLSH